MLLRHTLFAFLVLSAFGVSPEDAHAAKNEHLQSQLARAAGDIGSTMRGIDRTLDKLPAKVSTDKWTSIKAGALEIKDKAEELSAMLRKIETDLSDMHIGREQLTRRLNEMVGEFESLAGKAESDAASLPDELVAIAKRERDTWKRGAAITESFRDQYQTLLANYDERANSLKVVDPILVRMARGAEMYIELAAVGEDLEANAANLESFVDQLNAILEMFDGLATETENTIAASDPSTSRIFKTAFSAADRRQKPSRTVNAGESPGPSLDSPIVSITHVDASSRLVAFKEIEANVGDLFLAYRQGKRVGEVIVEEHRGGHVIASWHGDVSPKAGDLVWREVRQFNSLALASH